MMPQLEPKLGELLNGDEGRDAIHIAIVPVRAAEFLLPGSPVRLLNDEAPVDKQWNGHWVVHCGTEEMVGIIDPFLTETMKYGDVAYCYLKPYTITSLRHEWTHPAFEAVPEGQKYVPPAAVISQRQAAQQKAVVEAHEWLQNFIDEWNFKVSVEELVQMAQTASLDKNGWSDTWLTAHEVDLHSKGELGEDWHKMWECVSALTGKVFDEEHKEKLHFSCSC